MAQILQLTQLFQLLQLVHIYGDGFYELSRMLMGKNVNNDVSKDSPIGNENKRVLKLTLFLYYSNIPRGITRHG